MKNYQLYTLFIKLFFQRHVRLDKKNKNIRLICLLLFFCFFVFLITFTALWGKCTMHKDLYGGLFSFSSLMWTIRGSWGFFAYAINLTPDLTVKLLIKKRFSLCLHVSIISVKLDITKMDLQWEHDISFDSVRKANLVLGGIFLVVMTSCNKDAIRAKVCQREHFQPQFSTVQLSDNSKGNSHHSCYSPTRGAFIV